MNEEPICNIETAFIKSECFTQKSKASIQLEGDEISFSLCSDVVNMNKLDFEWCFTMLMRNQPYNCHYTKSTMRSPSTVTVRKPFSKSMG